MQLAIAVLEEQQLQIVIAATQLAQLLSTTHWQKLAQVPAPQDPTNLIVSVSSVQYAAVNVSHVLEGLGQIALHATQAF